MYVPRIRSDQRHLSSVVRQETSTPLHSQLGRGRFSLIVSDKGELSLYFEMWSTLLVKNFFLFVHFLVLLLLVSVAIWDAVHILQEYVTDNRLTVVKILNASETAPYFKNERLKICLADYKPSLFPESWLRENMDSLHNFKVRTTSDADLMQNATLFFKENSDEMPLLQEFIRGRILHAMYYMDNNIINCIHQKVTNLSYDECTYWQTFSPVSFILENQTYLELVEETMWQKLHRHLFSIHEGSFYNQTFEPVLETLIQERLLYYNDKDLCFFLYPSDIVSSGTLQPRLLLGPFWGSNPYKNVTTSFTLTIETLNFKSPNLEIVYNAPDLYEYTNSETGDKQYGFSGRAGKDILLTIRNIGTYDKTLTSSCDQILHSIYLGGTSHSECEIQSTISFLAKSCNCVPFTYRRQLQNNEAYGKRENVPFCTPKIIKECMKFSTPVEYSPCLPACVIVKNQYTLISENTVGGMYCNGLHCTSNTVTLSYDSFFAVNEERFQFTGVQILSQVGGDIGLYTGISMLGIWQCLVFIYEQYKKHKSHQNSVNATEESITAAKRKAVTAFMKRYFIEIASVTLDNREENELHQDSEQPGSKNELAGLKEHVSAIDGRLAMIEKRLEDIFKNVVVTQGAKRESDRISEMVIQEL